MGFYILLLILAMGMLSRSKLVMLTASILLIFRILHLQRFFKFLSNNGINMGLLLLVMTVLIPFATDQVTLKDLKDTMTSFSGIIAILGGLLATKLNGMGLNLLKVEPQLVIGMVVGSIIGIIFWGGVPVGPLMAGGLTALFIKILGLL
ncbi:hypothetical protein BBF96_13970 [Anoxybacter fermentans]|uniref:UPF0756 membrane protein BBF96_13970 n=1 Tax=Anoxybacter fermentans TaxID=1323375 RepID=A0A3Q9HSJ7_9FIRM|nr:DUF441 domain-containing protein [Anoxybacter fermentans]AZR74396.1 hypothetical protein BBF96_13970 [Anoxybacter fermentans]